MLIAPESYSPPDALRFICNDLTSIPCRYLCHGFFPSTLAETLPTDILIATRAIGNFGASCILGLHNLWLTRCSIIHLTSSEGVAAEEILDLQDEILAVQQSEEYLGTLAITEIPHLNDLTSQSTGALKGWLFAYYTAIRDFDSYDGINNRSLRHKNKVIRDASVDDLALRDRLQQNG